MSKTTPRSVSKPGITKLSARRRTDEELVGAPLARIYHVHERLNHQERVTAATLAADWQVSRSTVKRDLDVMRDRLGMPIEWDPVRQTYYFTRPCDTLPLLNLDMRDALTLALVGRVCEGFYGASFGRRLDAILKKIAPILGGALSIAVDSLEHVHPPDARDTLEEFEKFFPLLEAIRGRRELRLEYAKPLSARAEKRLVHPLTLTRRDLCWLLVAYDPARRALRSFRLARIRSITSAGKTFARPAEADLARFLRGSMGAFAGDREHEVRIALDEHAAFYAREQPWHPSQKLNARPDGRVEMTLRLNHLADAKNAVLRWGEHAEVLSPPELRDDVHQSLQRALAQYPAP